jgi:dipeptidyl aminopeptidase/acylaminoacyl peptidase
MTVRQTVTTLNGEQAVSDWSWIEYLDRLSDGAVEYTYDGWAKIKDMKAAERRQLVVLEEEHAERDVHVTDRLDGLIAARVFQYGADEPVDPGNGASGIIRRYVPTTSDGPPVVLISWKC